MTIYCLSSGKESRGNSDICKASDWENLPSPHSTSPKILCKFFMLYELMKFDSFNYPPLTFWNSKRKVLIKKVTFLFSRPVPITFSTFHPVVDSIKTLGEWESFTKFSPKTFFLSRLLETFCFFLFCFSRLLLNVSQILASSDGKRGKEFKGGIYIFSTWAEGRYKLKGTLLSGWILRSWWGERNWADLMISESWNNEKQRLEIGQEKLRLITNFRAFHGTKLKAITTRWFH